MAFIMAQVERWQRVRHGFVANGCKEIRPKMPLWRSYASAVSLSNDPCDETTIGAEVQA